MNLMRSNLLTGFNRPIKSVEAFPRKSLNLEELDRTASVLSDKAHFITSPDNPMGGPGIGPIMTTYMIASRSSLIPMPHITPRDRNRIQIQSDVLTAMKLGIRNFFTISGDPINPKFLSREVREVDTMGLIDCVLSSKEHLPEESREEDVAIGSALNPFRESEEAIARSKISHGTDFFITQVLFDPEALKKDWIKERKFRILAGFMPLSRKSQIQFIEKIGSRIPEHTKERLENSDNIEETSSRIIKDAYDDLRGYVDGIHLMPLGKNEVAAKILECI